MSIPGIKELSFEQYVFNAPVPKEKSGEKYIAKDFVLVLGEVKIKLSKNDTLRDVIRKINLKSHVTGVRAKAVKGQLFLESTTKGKSQPLGITLPQKSYGEAQPLNANQIIANYLASLPPKISTGTQEESIVIEENEEYVLLQEDLQYKNELEAFYDLYYLII